MTHGKVVAWELVEITFTRRRKQYAHYKTPKKRCELKQ